MAVLKKYKKPEMEIVLIKNDVIITSGMGPDQPSPGEGGDPFESSIGKMNSYSRPLGIFKRD